MNDVYHQEVERWARQQRDHLHDRVDDLNHPTARMLYRNMQEVEDMAQQGHNFRGIHDKLQATQRILDQAKHSNEHFMSPEHVMEMHHNLELKKIEMRKHPHFN
jgi:hypothetical protein